MFASRLHYSKDDFYSLTPVEANDVLERYYDDQTDFYNYLSNEFRNINYYTYKTIFGDTKSVRFPKDLYPLPTEVDQAEKAKQAFKDNQGVVFDEADKAILTRYGFQF